MLNRPWGATALRAVLVVALGLFFAAPPAYAAAAEHQMELKAREAYAAGRYEEALNLFAKLYAETLHPVYLRNIGRCHQKMREPQKAIDAFKDYLAKSKKIPPDERTEVEGYIKEMEALRDEQAKAALPPPPPPVVMPLPPAPPPAPVPTATASSTLVSQPAPPPSPSSPFYTKWWFWTAVGVVAAGTV